MPLTPEHVSFDGPEELAELCEIICGRLHQANRIAMGESRFTSQIADLFARLGRTFERGVDSDLRMRQFGNGYKEGTLSPEEQRDLLIRLLFPQLPATRARPVDDV